MGGIREMQNEVLTGNIKRRLKRIEGQIKGIERMIDDDCSCMDVLVQVSAARAAISKVGAIILENHANKCLTEALQKENGKEELENLMSVISNFIR
jgi:DNA-binding FrmR family transcriptional regulator